MDPKTIEINNLRVLNDNLNQTIEALLRTQRNGVGGFAGLGLHTQYGAPYAGAFGHNGTDAIFGSSVFNTNPFAAQAAQGMPYSLMNGNFGSQFATNPFASVYPNNNVVDALLHRTNAPIAGIQGIWPQQQQLGWSAQAELLRQVQLTQALAARQTVLETICRAAGVPV